MSTDAPHAHALARLIEGLAPAAANLTVTDVTLDSRAVTPGALFLACRGQRHHGLEFAPQAIARGAAAVLFEPPVAALPDFGSDIFVAPVPNLTQQAGAIADRFFDAPSSAMSVAGITGTNGKTTSAFVLAQALGLCERPAAYSGTLGVGFPEAIRPGTHTTPDVVSVHRELDALRRAGASCVCMEVSSHALDQSRVDAVRFHTALFTNLTRDHLDYHGTMAHYAAAKAKLFAWPGLSLRVVNIDDAFGAELASRPAPSQLIVTSRQARVPHAVRFVQATGVTVRETGLECAIESSWGRFELVTRLVGDFNVENLLGVTAVLLGLGIGVDQLVSALARCHAPSGRMESFGGGECALAIVDYAHTPDALEKALRAARAHCRGRLRVVFGCGGDRDAGKRPLMGAIAARLADELVITDDNPRTEDAAAIVAQIRTGIDAARAVQVEHDRARAISAALERSGAGDVVLIAGKGHEDYQIYGHERRPFSDQTIVRERLKAQSCSAR